jgi:hypothetical protein
MAQKDIDCHELKARMSLVAAEPEDRFGSKSPNSPPGYVSSEATEPDVGPGPDPVCWDEVRRKKDLWKAHSERSTENNYRIAAELGRRMREHEEQEFFKRTGLRIIRNRGEHLRTCTIRRHANCSRRSPHFIRA